jgi:hypothetical protein
MLFTRRWADEGEMEDSLDTFEYGRDLNTFNSSLVLIDSQNHVWVKIVQQSKKNFEKQKKQKQSEKDCEKQQLLVRNQGRKDRFIKGIIEVSNAAL